MAAPGPPAGSSDRIVNEPARTVVRAVVGFPGTEAVGRPGEIGKLVRGSRGCGPGARPGPAIRLRDLDFLSGLCQPGSRSLDGRPAPREQVRVRVARPDYSEGRDFDRRQRVLGRSQCDPGRRPTLFRQLADQSERARGRPPARGPQAMERPSGADGPRGPQPIRHHPRRSLSRPDLGSRHPSIQPAGSHRGERRAEPDLGFEGPSGISLRVGLAAHTINYTLVQRDNVQLTDRTLNAGWVEWTPTWGISLRFSAWELHYRGSVTGTEIFRLGGDDVTVTEPSGGGNILAAARGPLNMTGLRVIAHQFSISVPIH